MARDAIPVALVGSSLLLEAYTMPPLSFRVAWLSLLAAACSTVTSTTGKTVSAVPILCRARYFKAVGQGAGFSGMALSGYGNWCGKGGDGITLDDYDACCKTHDKCYANQRCSIFNMGCKPACNACDDAVVRCWQAARARRPERYGKGPRFLYPCKRCYQRSLFRSEKRRLRCNRKCRAAMFPMPKGQRCEKRAPCARGLRCEAGRCTSRGGARGRRTPSLLGIGGR